MSIKDIQQKIKWNKIYWIMIGVLAFSSTVLGFKLFLVTSNREEPVQIKPLDLSQNRLLNEVKNKPSGLLVASKNGKKYYFPSCFGAKRISESNKIWFNSFEEAKKAGYSPATNCLGLE